MDLIASAYKFWNYEDLEWKHYGDGDYRGEIEKMVNKNVLVGQVSNAEIIGALNLYKETGFLINVSKYEGIPVSMMEAMSFGIPCIGTDVGGVSEIIDSGKERIFIVTRSFN